MNNKEINPKDTPSLLQTNIDNNQKIVLQPNNHSLRLVFSALDMTNTEYLYYAYMLEGFEKSYRIIGHEHEANYTNLPAGQYIFRVKSTNSEGVWVNNERTLTLEVLPAFSETVYAKILFLTLILIVSLIVIYIYIIFYKMKQKVKNEEYMTQLKLDFFTNISHELRTPLTLITSPLEIILKDKTLPVQLRESLDMIKKNSKSMQRLVTEILDFRKVQESKMLLMVQYSDIVFFTKSVAEHFSNIALLRSIILSFSSTIPVCYLWFDEDKMERVIFNLLSNAFKYSPDHKNIQVNITESADSVSIQVVDQGIGIPKAKQENIFSRFESIEQKNSNSIMSSGIGLALVKELIELHKGSVSVESENGVGSIFTVTLRKGNSHYSTDKVHIVGNKKMEYVRDSLNMDDFFPVRVEKDECQINGNQLMLVVEDNNELRLFIKQVFRNKFNIIEAQDGNEGLEKAFSMLPDIILTDIMMPVKNGIQMLQELRDDERTSHIPAVILTAKSDIDSILTGVRTGADDYITKPFSVDYLYSKVDALLTQRKKLQIFYSQNYSIKNETKNDVYESQLSEKDIAFLLKLDEIMEKQMSNPDLNVDYIVSFFSLSRTNFFHKLKSLTGFSPIMYIRDARMKKAADLLGKRDFSVAEVAYMVGFNDPHYFSKIFKIFWGMNATEYAKKINQKESENIKETKMIEHS